jgi:formylmethanofuran dehydrogenase subunit D
MSKGVNLGIGNDGVVSGQLYTGMGEMNIRSFNTGMDNVKQFNLDSNISPMVNVMQMIDDFVIQDTGENIKAPYSSPAGTLGEVEIIEQNKALRVKTIDESRDICLDYVLSQVLSNIANFAPKVLCQKEDDKGKVKITYPMISVKNSKVESKRGKIEVTEDYGKYGFFELKPQTISDQMKVKVTTFSTRTALKAIAKDEFTQFIQNVTAIAQLDPQMLQKINFDGVLDLMNTIYQYDDKMSATTVKDEIKKKNLQIMESIKALTGLPQ